MNTKLKIFLLGMLALLTVSRANAFCGFYVAKADIKLFNKSSQVIVARDGNHTVITMSSDYSGDAKDFAMVVPVPEVLKESDIRVVQQYIFDKFDTYTSPRLVEYWDQAPCYNNSYDYLARPAATSMSRNREEMDMSVTESAKDLGVKIEAKYTVGEYDILILSAKESTGLKTWLTQNDYKIPSGADEVLEPYIKDEMKFFVVKVNLEKQKAMGVQTLRPLQIQFNSSRFMLPIRLGMANASGPQDMIVYTFTRKGRVETTNYRTTKLPTDREIPEFVQTEGLFPTFYKDLYGRAWEHEGKNSVMLEYAWDVSSQQSVKCDPCPTPPISFAEMREAGVWWVEPDGWSGSYVGDLFITRLHVRYSRSTFPQDLMFVNTPDQSSFQGRYVIRHAAQGNLECEEGKRYKAELRVRRQKELHELAALTGWEVGKWSSYIGGIVTPDPVLPSLPTLRDSFLPQQSSCPTCPIGVVLPPLAPISTTPAALPSDSSPGAVAATPATPQGGLANEQNSVAASEAFLKAGLSTSKPFLSTRGWLFSIAGLMFAVGMVVRITTRKPKLPHAAS